jgi:hypothetical protein
MVQAGLSTEIFTSRIIDSGSVIENWPFSHVTPAAHFTEHGRAPVEVYTTNSQAVVIGEVEFAAGATVTFLQEDFRRPDNAFSATRLCLPLGDRPAARAWEQMHGVKLALEVELTDEKHTRMRTVQPLRILGVEQPIYSPRWSPQGRTYRSQSAARSEGFIQGMVLQDTQPSHYYRTRLHLGAHAVEGLLICSYATMSRPTGSQPATSPLTGDHIRSRVVRNSYNPTVFASRYETHVFIAHRADETDAS